MVSVNPPAHLEETVKFIIDKKQLRYHGPLDFRVWGLQRKTIIILARIVGDFVTCFLPAAQSQFHHLCCIGPRVQPGSSRLDWMQGARGPKNLSKGELQFEYQTANPSNKNVLPERAMELCAFKILVSFESLASFLAVVKVSCLKFPSKLSPFQRSPVQLLHQRRCTEYN